MKAEKNVPAPVPMVVFQGKAYSAKDLEKYTFPIGCKFQYSNASYNDLFTVAGIRKEPGSEFRQIIGSVAGEVWMLLTSLQKEAAVGAVTFIETKVAEAPVKEKKAKKSKGKKA